MPKSRSKSPELPPNPDASDPLAGIVAQFQAELDQSLDSSRERIKAAVGDAPVADQSPSDAEARGEVGVSIDAGAQAEKMPVGSPSEDIQPITPKGDVVDTPEPNPDISHVNERAVRGRTDRGNRAVRAAQLKSARRVARQAGEPSSGSDVPEAVPEAGAEGVGDDFSQWIATREANLRGLIEKAQSPSQYAELRKQMSPGTGTVKYFFSGRPAQHELKRKVTEKEMDVIRAKNGELGPVARRKFEYLIEGDLLAQEQSGKSIECPWKEASIWEELSEPEQTIINRKYETAGRRYQERQDRKASQRGNGPVSFNVPAASDPAPEASVKSNEQKPFLTEEGKIFRFSGNSGISRDLRLMREGDQYYFLDQSGVKIGDTGSTEATIRDLAMREEWVSVLDAPTPEGPVLPVSPDIPAQPEPSSEAPSFLLELPQDGEQFFYRDNKGKEFKITKSKDRFTMALLLAGKEQVERELEEAKLQALARNTKWQRFEPQTKTEKEPFPELKIGDVWGRYIDPVKGGDQTCLINDIDADNIVDVLEQTRDVNGALKENQYTLSLEQLEQRLKEGGYRLYANNLGLLRPTLKEKTPVPTSPLSPTPEASAPSLDILPLPLDGESILYNTPKGIEQIRREGDVYYIALPGAVAFGGTLEGPFVEKDIRRLIEREGWTLAVAEASVSPENLEAALEEAWQAVNEARADFVRIEAEQKGKLKWLKNILPILRGKEELNEEVRQYWEVYESALVRLQGLEVDRLKQSNLSGEKLHREIAALVRTYDFEEAERLDDAKREVRLGKGAASLKEKWKHVWQQAQEVKHQDNKTTASLKVIASFLGVSGTMVARGVKTVGQGYNGLSRKKWGKGVIIGASAVGGGLLLFGGGAAALGMAALVTKRLAGGAGVAIALAEAGDAIARSSREKKSVEQGELISTLVDEQVRAEKARTGTGESATESFSEDIAAELKRYLEKEIRKGSRKAAEREKWRLYRKTGALFVGTILGTRGEILTFGMGDAVAETRASGEGIREVARNIEGDLPQEGSGALPQPAAANAATPSTHAPGPQEGSEERTDPPRETVPVTGTESTVTAKGLLGERTIKPGDTLSKYVMVEAKTLGLESKDAQARLSALVSAKVDEKLAGMSPDAARAAGFIPGKDGVFSANLIAAQETLDLGKVLSTDELNTLVEEAKKVPQDKLITPEAPSERVPERVVQATAAVLEEAGIVPTSEPITPTPASVTTETIVPTPDKTDWVNELKLGKRETILAYVHSLPRVEQAEIFRTMRSTVRDLFHTDAASLYSLQYDANYDPSEHPELAKTSMTRVLEDHKALSSKAFYMYDRATNPLHWTQMQGMASFYESAANVLGGGIALPRTRESIEEYVLRVATIARAQGQTVPGLHMVK